MLHSHIQEALQMESVRFKSTLKKVDTKQGPWCIYLAATVQHPEVLVVSPDGKSYTPTDRNSLEWKSLDDAAVDCGARS